MDTDKIVSSEALIKAVREKVLCKTESLNECKSHNQNLIQISRLKHSIALLNQTWNIKDSKIISNKRVIGKVIVLIKRTIRKSIYWLIRPYWNKQIIFNREVLNALEEIEKIILEDR